MSRPATSRLKVNAPLGLMPALQYLLPAQLKIDPAYQRTLDTGPNQTLVRRIATHWNWDLCQPLVVARRADGDLFVIDGQHRLEAARMRGDIAQLPAVVVQYESAADEAASFVHLNQQRRPLSKLDVFKAAVASEDPQSCEIVKALHGVGLSVAPHSNYQFWKPGMVSNIGGIETAWRVQGAKVTGRALLAIADAYRGQVLRYAGTIFPGIVHVAAALKAGDADELLAFVGMLRATSQADWTKRINRRATEVTGGRREAAKEILGEAWAARARSVPAPAPRQAYTPPPIQAASDGKRWCDQCDTRVHLSAATMCKDRHCKLRPRLTR